MTIMDDAPTVALGASFDVKELKAALGAVKPAVGKGAGALPVLTHVRIEAADGVARVSADDLDLSLEAVLACGAGDVTVLAPAVWLGKVLTRFKTGRCELAPTDGGIVIRHGATEVEVSTTPVADWPRVADDGGHNVVLSCDAIAEVLPAAGTDDDYRPALCGVCVDGGAYVATDSFRLAAVDTGADTGPVVIIPRRAAQVMAKAGGFAPAVVGARDVRAQLRTGVVLRSRLVDAAFPQWRSLVPASAPVAFTFDGRFTEALEGLLAVAPGNGCLPVRIAPADEGAKACEQELRLELRTEDGVAAVTTGGRCAIAIAFKPQYLLSTVAGTTSGEVHAASAVKPAVVTESAPEHGEGATRTRLIMPVRVS